MTTLEERGWFRPVAKIFRHSKPAEAATDREEARFEVRSSLLPERQVEAFDFLNSAIGHSHSVLLNVRGAEFLRIENAPERIDEAEMLLRCRVDFLICRRLTLQPCGAIYFSLGDQPDPLGCRLYEACRNARFPLLFVDTKEKSGIRKLSEVETDTPIKQIESWLSRLQSTQSLMRADPPHTS